MIFFIYLQVQQKRWKVETNSRLDSVLLLSAVNLPGGELVRCLFCHPIGGAIMSKVIFVMIKNVNFVCVRGEDQQKMSSQ